MQGVSAPSTPQQGSKSKMLKILSQIQQNETFYNQAAMFNASDLVLQKALTRSSARGSKMDGKHRKFYDNKEVEDI